MSSPCTPPTAPPRFWAPWRSDPRPLEGLLHGAYAHLALAGYWQRAALYGARGAWAQHARIRAQVAAALPVIRACPELTRRTRVHRRHGRRREGHGRTAPARRPVRHRPPGPGPGTARLVRGAPRTLRLHTGLTTRPLRYLSTPSTTARSPGRRPYDRYR
ncbi:HEXXH motif-containing putative peptide modification protein [Streptomyces goshikiensis]|uniref:aKG-HExxH-type peptide beta-hydroxylase n=1 Tax=Streptomyces goshikiensis TaxID=1942 RepID=UPI0036239965